MVGMCRLEITICKEVFQWVKVPQASIKAPIRDFFPPFVCKSWNSWDVYRGAQFAKAETTRGYMYIMCSFAPAPAHPPLRGAESVRFANRRSVGCEVPTIVCKTANPLGAFWRPWPGRQVTSYPLFLIDVLR
jgi:hypothetical protein